MSLEKISAQLTSLTSEQGQKIPPVERWNPPYCGEMDLVIKADGSWFYHGTVFKRLPLVKLLASVLICEVNEKAADEYFLVTPVEKIKISVEDAPLILTQWQWHNDQANTMVVATNLDDEFLLTKDHPMTVAADGCLYVTVRRNLLAKVHRNVYYQWIDLAKEHKTAQGVDLVFKSAGEQFSLGRIE